MRAGLHMRETQCQLAKSWVKASDVTWPKTSCHTFPPNLSSFPAAPPPLLVRAAAALAASSAEVCFAGLAFPIPAIQYSS